MNSKMLIITVAIIAVLGFLLLRQKVGMPSLGSPIAIPEEQDNQTPYQASFAIYTNGIFREFSLPMYHNLSDEVYINAQNPNVVTINKQGTTWNDFFSTLPFSLDNNCLTTGTGETFCSGQGGDLNFYLNGVQKPDALFNEIKPGDQLLVTFGNNIDSEINIQIESIPEIP